MALSLLLSESVTGCPFFRLPQNGILIRGAQVLSLLNDKTPQAAVHSCADEVATDKSSTVAASLIIWSSNACNVPRFSSDRLLSMLCSSRFCIADRW